VNRRRGKSKLSFREIREFWDQVIGLRRIKE